MTSATTVNRRTHVPGFGENTSCLRCRTSIEWRQIAMGSLGHIIAKACECKSSRIALRYAGSKDKSKVRSK